MLFTTWRRWLNPGKSLPVKNLRRERERLAREHCHPNVEGLECRIVPTVALTKTANSATAVAGQDITYTIQVQSTDMDDFSSMLDDRLPAGTTFVSESQNPADPTQWTFTPPGASPNAIWTTPFLPQGETDTFTLVLNIDPTTSTGNLTNTVRYNSIFIPAPGTPASATVAVTSTADVAVALTANPSPITAGTDITYDVTVTNNGPGPADNVTMTDAVPAGATFVSETQLSGPAFGVTNPGVGGTGTTTATIASLPAGVTAVFEIVDHVASSAPDGSTLTDTANVSTTSNDPNAANNSASVNTAVATAADLSITKAGPAAATAGTNVTYTLTLANLGPSDAQNPVLFDSIPAGTTFVSITQQSGATTFFFTPPPPPGSGPLIGSAATLPANETDVFVLTVTINSNVPDGSTVSNTASVFSSTNDPNGANDSSTVLTTIATSADLSVGKTAPATVTAGADFTYSITLTNSGPSDAQNVNLSDSLPANTTFVSATAPANFTVTAPNPGQTGTVSFTAAAVGAGENDTFTIVVHTGPSTPAGTTITNTATVSSTTADANAANNTSTATSIVATSADLAVTKTGPATVTAGSNVTYTVTLTNNGPSDAQNVTLSDAVPANTTFVSATQTSGPAFTITNPPVGGGGTITATDTTFAASGTATFQIVVHVGAGTANGSTVSNTATAVATTADANAANNTSTVTSAVATSADLAVTKTGPPVATAGTDITYAITLTNNGPSDAQNATLSDTLPAGTTLVSFTQTSGPATGGTLPANGTETFSLVVHVNSNVAQNTTLTNTANASSTTPDANSANNSSSVNTTVVTVADLAVTKTAPATATAGANLTYTISLTNNGPSDAQSVALTDVIPGNTTFVSETQTSGPAFTLTTPPAGGTGTVSDTIAALSAGASATFTLVLAVNASAPNASTINNTATIGSTTADSNPANNSSTTATTVATAADLSVVKTGPAAVTAGSDLTYTLTVANAGPSDAQTVVVSDAVPAGTTFVSATQTGGPAFQSNTPAPGSTGTVTFLDATFAAGASATFTIVVHANASDANGSTITNTANISSSTTDTNAGNNTSSATTTVTAVADVAVTKTGPATAFAGTQVTYTLVVSNSGPSDAQGVNLTDTLPAGETFVSASQGSGAGTAFTAPLGTVAAGSSTTITLVAQINPNVPNGSALTDTATATTTTTDTNAANNTATLTTTVSAAADVSITKTGPATATAGTQVTYTLSVTNNGPSDAQGVSLSDTLPAGETFVSASTGTGSGTSYSATLGTLAAGASTTVTIVAQVSPGVANGSTLTDSATVTSTTTDTNAANNTATFNTTVNTAADLSITKTGPATATAGTQVTYTLSVTNNGPSDAQGVTLSDTLPAGETFVSSSSGTGSGTSFSDTVGTLAAGASTTVTIVAQVSASAANGSALTDTATVSSTTSDTNAANNTATLSTTVATAADLAVTKTGPATATAGTNVTYTITLTNAGPSDAQNISLTDDTPAGTTFVSETHPAGFTSFTPAPGGTGTITETSPSLAAGASATFTIVVHVGSGSTITNTASAASTTTDTNAANNTSTVTTTVATAADLAVTKTGPATAAPGSNITYTITLTNNGPSDASTVSLTDATPAGTTFVSETHSAGFTSTTPAVGATGTITESAPSLAGGATATFTIVVNLAASSTAGSTITNTAAATTTTTDTNSANNSSTATTTVAAASADLAITKTGPATATQGTPVTYTLTVTNNGPSDAASVVVTDTLPTGGTLDSFSFPQGSQGTGAASNTFDLGTVAAGATVTGTIVITLSNSGTATDTATVSAATADSNSANNTATATTTVTAGTVSGTGVPVNGFERSPLNNVQVATFTFDNGTAPASSFTATIDWGDGTSSAGTVTSNNGSYSVTGTHTYNDEKVFPIVVTVSGNGTSMTINTTGTILEELLFNGARGTADQRWLSEVYRDMLGRPIDGNGLATWTAELNTGVSRFQVVQNIQNAPTLEYRAVEVQALYQQYLHRAADSSGLTTWENFLQSGGTVEQVAASLAASPEYNQRFDGSGNTGANDSWLDEFYKDVFNRAVDASGRSTWDTAFADGASRAQVATSIFTSTEYHQDLVKQYYNQFLDRTVDGSGFPAWTGVLNSGIHDELVIASIVSSPEFYDKTSA